MSSFTISLQPNVDTTVDLVAVQDDGTPIDLRGATVTECVKDGSGALVLTVAATITDGENGRYSLFFAASATRSLPLATYIHSVKATLSDGSKLSLVDPSFWILALGGVVTSTPPVFANTFSVDHNFDIPDNLRYMDAGGNPIGDAQIRVYLKSDFDAGLLNAPVGVSLTGADGRWTNPVLVIPGFDYVVQLFAPNRFGPDRKTITV